VIIAWLTGLPLIVGAAALARVAARRGRRAALVLAGVGAHALAEKAPLLVGSRALTVFRACCWVR
jgi:hypothetical protein